MSTDTTISEGTPTMDPKELEARLRAVETAQATTDATLAGAQATQAASQAGIVSTNAAAHAGTIATMAAGSVSLILGIFLGIAIRNAGK
jgi:hypothetical protein